MMQDITELMYEYLEAKRHIWNTYFKSKVTSLRECSPLDQYEEIDRLLFNALVIQELSLADKISPSSIINEPWKYLRVKARKGLSLLQLKVSDPIKDNNRVWNEFSLIEISESSSFGFIKFFDWVPYGFTTYPYIKLKIDEQSKLPELTGREALIDVMNGSFWISK